MLASTAMVFESKLDDTQRGPFRGRTGLCNDSDRDVSLESICVVSVCWRLAKVGGKKMC